MAFDFFWTQTSEEQGGESAKPLHTVDLDDDIALLKWLKATSDKLKKTNQALFENQRRNLSIYRNDNLSERQIRGANSTTDIGTPIRVGPRVNVNHIYDVVETKTSMMTRVKPAVEIIPRDDQHNDKLGAKIAKKFIEHIWSINDLDTLLQKLDRIKYICGEVYLKIGWCKNKGDLHPAYAAVRNSENAVQKDERGNIVIPNADGTTTVVKGEVRVGDVEYEIKLPWRILLEQEESFDEVKYYFELDVENTDTLKRDYPTLAGKIRSNTDAAMFDLATMSNKKLENQTIKYCFTHKKTPDFPEGLKIEFTDAVILKKEALGYEHGELDILHITDMDFPDMLHGISFMEQVKDLQSFSNNITNMYAKHAWLLAHPKWMLPKGACDIKDLANEVTVVQWRGAVPPQLVVPHPISNDLLELADRTKDQINQLGAVKIARSEPPAGIYAAVALQFLNEQETERNSMDIAKHNILVRTIAQRTLAVAGQYYKESDGRTMRVLGEEGKYLSKKLSDISFHKDYDVVIQNSTALPQSKAAQVQKIIEIMQYNKELLPAERWVDLLDLGSADKMVTLITAAIDSAEAENDAITEGAVPQVCEWEDDVLHLSCHYKFMQKLSFKDFPPEIQQEFKEHVEDHEYQAYNKMAQNPLFEARLAQLQLFPMFYKMPVQPQSAEQKTAIVNGQANMGAPVTAAIPAQEMMAMTPNEMNRIKPNKVNR